MKKLLYIIPLLAMLSCNERWEENLANDDTLSTTISVVLPQLPEVQSDTRAITKVNELQTLHLAVFDESGQLTQYLAAQDLAKVTGDAGNVNYTYKVEGLELSSSPRIIHFIGNGPQDVTYGDEVAVIANLYTAEDGQYADAYWQRVVLEDGIANDDATKTALSGVQLIRNFAWIELKTSTDCSNFTIDSYYVVNTYNRGTIAPYNTTVGKGWISDYEDKDYSALVGEGYHGFTPPVSELNTAIPDPNEWYTDNSQKPYYIYERELNDKTPSYILVKGTYYPDGKTVTTTAKKDRYYKIDLRDANNGDYFPIIRNFKYGINITGIGHEGYDSPSEAASSGGSGDVSTASNTQSFTNIANEEVRLFIEYTEKTLVYDYDANSTETLQLEFTLRYKFIDLSTSTSHNDITNVTINPENKTENEYTVTGDVISYLHRVRNEGEEETDKEADDADGWRTITMKTVSIPVNKELDKRQEIVIVGVLNGYTLQRKVTLKLRSRYTMDVSCDPNEITSTLGSPFELVIWVPGGLGSSMFPLDFQIEAQAQSITPNQGDDLPVVTGKSIIAANSGKTTIGFMKQVDYSAYEDAESKANTNGYRPIRCHFKSNKASSATNIYVQNEYFYQDFTYLGNYVQQNFTIVGFNKSSLPIATNEPVTFTFRIPGGNNMPSKVYIDLQNLEPVKDQNPTLVRNSATGLYEYTPTASQAETVTVTLNLQTIVNPTGNIAKVKLSANHFADAESIDLPLVNKTFNPTLTATTNPTLPAGEVVTLALNMSGMPSGDVAVTLTNLEPAEGATRATFENGVYTFRPNTKTPTLYFKVVKGGQRVSAGLSATYFTDASASLEPRRGTFSDLVLTPSNKMLKQGTGVDFTFTMSFMPTSVVTVTLGNLQPATSETRLTPVTGQSGVYSFTPEAETLSEPLKLIVINSYQTVSAQLSADYFNNASESLIPKGGSFSNPQLTPDNATLPADSYVTLDFEMSDMPAGAVEVTLTNLEPVEGATRATSYTFTPDGLKQSLRFKVVTAGTTVKVELSADNFDKASASSKPKILAGMINVGNNSNISNKKNSPTTFTLYTQNPTNSWRPSGQIGSFTAIQNGSNSTMDLPEGTETIYVRFTKTSGKTTYYYVAELDLDKLDATITLGTEGYTWTEYK